MGNISASKRARLEEMCEDKNIMLIILPEVEPFGIFSNALRLPGDIPDSTSPSPVDENPATYRSKLSGNGEFVRI